MALKNQNISKANPSVIANRAFIDALYREKYNRKATNAEYNRFKNSTVKDVSNIVLGQELSPFTNAALGQPVTPVRQTSVAIPNPSVIKDYNVTGRSADGKTLMGTPKVQEQSVTPIAGVHYNKPGVGPGEVTPPPAATPPLVEPVTGLDKASYDRINSYIDSLGLTQTEKDFLKGTFLNKDTYTSGQTVPTTTQISQWIADAATNAASDINPYYTRISSEELADYKTAMENIRAKSETYQAQTESTYKQKLQETKQNLRTRGLTFSGSAIRNIGQQAAVTAPSGYEGTLQTARRLGYEENLQNLSGQAAQIGTAAERRLGSNVIGGVGDFALPEDLSKLHPGSSIFTGTGQYTGKGSMAPTIEQERVAAIEKSKQDRLSRWRLTF